MAQTKSAEEKTSQPEMKFPDPVAFAQTLMSVYQRAQPVIEEYLQKSSLDIGKYNFDPMQVQGAYLKFLENMISHPEKAWEAGSEYWQNWMKLWQESSMRMMGEKASAPVIEPDKSDRRFRDKDWQENAIFDFIKQSYLLTAAWMEKSVRDDDNLAPAQKEKLAFATKLFADALSPTNFLMTNPEVIRETMRTGGDNLLKGLNNLVADIERGGGELKISTTDYNAFELGKNIAVTPGAVVYQNDLVQLIQYEPTTKDVFKRPLLIIPPWINKYYILDLRPDNSFIKWAVSQGHTVFITSWVNPDKKLAQKKFEDYMNEGVLESLEQIEKITGEESTNVIGYCLGGTLLTATLSYLQAKKQDKKIASATFLTTLIDFENSGDLKLFMDDEQLAMMDKDMAEKGVFEAKSLQKTFSLLRANDLIWSFVINNYLMGKEPFPFDLLYWNDDSTNMPAAMHSFYLRNMYGENKLAKPGGIEMDGVKVDVRKIKTPAYFLSTREDHIAPWQATYDGAKLLGGDVTFTLAASGHIAGVVNAPDKKKYCHWESSKLPADPDQWMKNAKEHEGSWWPHWQKWVAGYGDGKIKPRAIKKPIEPAPGSYVKVKG